jgi:hypothetical protein
MGATSADIKTSLININSTVGDAINAGYFLTNQDTVNRLFLIGVAFGALLFIAVAVALDYTSRLLVRYWAKKR